MFRTYPYKGWAGLAILFFALSVLGHFLRQEKGKPEAMASVVSKDIQKREAALQEFLKNKRLIRKMFSDSLNAKEVEAISKEPFYVYGFENSNILLFWNSNTVVSNCDYPLLSEDKSLYKKNGVYFKKCIRLPFLKTNQYLVVLFPVVGNYPLANAYLQSGFPVADYIPMSTEVLPAKASGGLAVKNKTDQSLFYLYFKPSDLPRLLPDLGILTFLIAGILMLFVWSQLYALWLSRIKPFKGVFVIFATSVIFLLSLTWLVPFFNLDESPFFAPSLYASGFLYPSLGHLLLHLLCYLWLLCFTGWRFRGVYAQKNIAAVGSVLFQAGGSFLLVLTCVFISKAIRSIILDSTVSFDVSNFYGLDGYTIICILLSGIFCMLALLGIYTVNNQLKPLRFRGVKYGTVLVFALLFYFFPVGENQPYAAWVLVWLLITLLLLDLRLFPKKHFNKIEILLYSCAYLALAITPLLRHFISHKEEINRSSFVQQVVKEQDPMLEYLFKDIAQNITSNQNLQDYLLKPNPALRSLINTEISSRYLRGHLNRYEVSIRLYDSYKKPLFNGDTLALQQFERLRNDTVQPLQFVKTEAGSLHYLSVLPVRKKEEKAGTIVLDFSLKNAPNESLYPELLRPSNLQQINRYGQYTYAVYVNKMLVQQTNDHPFPLYLRNDTLKAGGKSIYTRDDYEILRYKTDAKTTVSIISYTRPQINWLTTFSCMLIAMWGIGILCGMFGYLFYFLSQKKTPFFNFQTNLRGRIFFAIPAIVFFSFLVIGVTTWFIFNDRNASSNKLRLRNTMHVVEHLVQAFLAENKVKTTYRNFNEFATAPAFRNFVSNLSETRSVDINVYDSLGTLMATSQEDIYNKGLLAEIMNPDAYHTLAEEEKAVELQEENIGNLKFLSCYVPLRNQYGKAFGYLNVPYFSSGKELSAQISNVLVALIDVYVFMLLISIIVAFVVSNRLTKGLKLITVHFEKFGIAQNEPISWDYEDEIGIMANAYNMNLAKAQEAIDKLAKSERETAWREMARQVAHEIKNPLTPMKLNIQYLQRALETNHPDLLKLTENVVNSMLEQIENLAYIATAFADFARMPEAKPELVNLNELLEKAVDLYQKSPDLTMELQLPKEALEVITDKSQMLRVVNNLLQNAVDAIPDERRGRIDIRLFVDAGFAVVEIEDNGIGIDEINASRIFNPYFTTKGSGTGLGLAMTKRIVEFWKGDISFKKAAEQGVIFTIHLPL